MFEFPIVRDAYEVQVFEVIREDYQSIIVLYERLAKLHLFCGYENDLKQNIRDYKNIS